MRRRLLCLIAASLLPAVGCTENKPAEPAKQPVAVAPPKPTPPPAPAAEVTASVSGKSDPDCVGPMEAAPAGKAEKVKLGKRTAEINGYKMSLQGNPDADDQAVIGVVASINEASGENLFNIDRYLKFFADKGAEMIIVAGDTGEDRPNIEAALRRLGKSGLAVVAFAGNRETKADFVDAVNAVHKDMPNVINGNRVRDVEWDDATVLTLPGHHDVRYIHAGKAGCQYFTEDLDSLAKMAGEAKGPVVLAAHTPPLGKAATAIDVIATDKQHAGDANLAKIMVSAKIPFGIFPNIKEAGGVATADVDGAKMLKEGTPSETLYLNPGAADGLEWTMNDGSSMTGSVAVLTVKGKEASFALYKAPKLTDPEKATAAKMAPAPGGAPAKATAKNE